MPVCAYDASALIHNESCKQSAGQLHGLSGIGICKQLSCRVQFFNCIGCFVTVASITCTSTRVCFLQLFCTTDTTGRLESHVSTPAHCLRGRSAAHTCGIAARCWLCIKCPCLCDPAGQQVDSIRNGTLGNCFFCLKSQYICSLGCAPGSKPCRLLKRQMVLL